MENRTRAPSSIATTSTTTTAMNNNKKANQKKKTNYKITRETCNETIYCHNWQINRDSSFEFAKKMIVSSRKSCVRTQKIAPKPKCSRHHTQIRADDNNTQ